MENVNQYGNPVPTFQQTEVPQLKALAEEAFSNGLAAVIMAEFPVASIFAIFKGRKAQKLAKEAENMAAGYGISAGGKNVAAKVMGIVGKISGIVNTALYAFLALYFVFYMLFMIVMLTGIFEYAG